MFFLINVSYVANKFIFKKVKKDVYIHLGGGGERIEVYFKKISFVVFLKNRDKRRKQHSPKIIEKNKNSKNLVHF